VIVHGGSDTFALAASARLLRRPRQLVAVDFLIPASRRYAKIQRWVLRGVTAWVCIRRGDIETLASRYDVERGRCHFVFFPPTFDPTDVVADPHVPVPERYVFTSGFAQRDWETLFAALTQVDSNALVSVVRDRIPPSARDLPARIVVLDHVSPEEGRSLAAGATIVIVPMVDTELPAGPSVLVDAMALGRPVIASDTRGTRDYVTDGLTGWLVPPHNADALARQIAVVLSDPADRARVGEQARRIAMTEYSAAQFANTIAEVLNSTPR
jgi:glycosyltransferase involved in cell wall biosynthesis